MRQCQVLAWDVDLTRARGWVGKMVILDPRGVVETQCSPGSLQSEISCRVTRPRYREDSVRYRRLVTDKRPVERRLAS